MMRSSYLVIGGGLIGAASALRLQRAGFDVTLLDSGDPRRGASFGNIGHLAAEQCEPLASPQMLLGFAERLYAFGGALDFRWRDAALWAPWAMRFAAASNAKDFAAGKSVLTALMQDAMGAWARLCAIAGAPDFIQAHGHAMLWMSPRIAERRIAAWKQSHMGSASCRDMTAAELDAYSSVMRARPVAGLMFSGTGKVSDPQALREALEGAFRAEGGTVRTGEARALDANIAGVAATLATGERVEAAHALVAAGAWSGALMKQLGVAAPLIGERGYSIQSAQHHWPATLPVTVFEERSLAVNSFSSGLRASSFVEFGAPDAPGDPRKWRHLQNQLRDLGIDFSPAPDCWVGPRPTLPDYLPAIGRLERTPNVLYAFGHQHLGLTLAAVTAEIVESLATATPSRIDLKPLRVERFTENR